MIVAFDFDDTVCVNTEYPTVGPPVPMAIDFLLQFEEAGAQLILWTMRSDQALQSAVEYLHSKGVQPWGINENPEQGSWSNSPKAFAHTLIDDAAFGCPLFTYQGMEVVDWSKVGPAVLSKIHTHDPGNKYGI